MLSVWSDVKAMLADKLKQNAPTMSNARQATPHAQGAMTIHFNPTINITGNGNVSAQMQQGLQMSLHELEKMLERIVAEKARRAY